MSKFQTTAHLIELDSVYFFAIAAFLGVVLALSAHHIPQQKIVLEMPIMQQFSNSLPTLEPSPKEIVTQVSPDGTMSLSMTSLRNADMSHTYTFQIRDTLSGQKTPLYTTTLPATDIMTIPFNSWSPDNNYVFLEHHAKDHTDALVFRADGQNILGSEKFINATEVYTAHQTGNTYQEVTGWASETLLIANTTLSDGSKGPSYWIEIPSKAVIQLSTLF